MAKFEAVLHGRLGGAISAWVDLVFPPPCAGCGRRGSQFCARCVAAVRPLRPPWCVSCGRSILAGNLCADCRLDPLPLASLRSAGYHTGPLRRAVHCLKYRGRKGSGRVLADLLERPAGELDPRWPEGERPLVVPIPLHPFREWERGYNQAALLARPLAAALGLPYAPGALRRLRPTASQVGLDRRRRRENVRGAFAAAPVLCGRAVLLVDDVATTGSTLGSAAGTCLEGGAIGVWALTLAREG